MSRSRSLSGSGESSGVSTVRNSASGPPSWWKESHQGSVKTHSVRAAHNILPRRCCKDSYSRQDAGSELMLRATQIRQPTAITILQRSLPREFVYFALTTQHFGPYSLFKRNLATRRDGRQPPQGRAVIEPRRPGGRRIQDEGHIYCSSRRVARGLRW